MTIKDELLQRLDGSRDVMLAALAAVPCETEIYPAWQIKHLLAHLAGWEEATATSLRELRQGEVYEIPAYRGIDDYNAHTVETRENLQYDQIYAEWEIARHELKDALTELPLELYEGVHMLPWGERASIESLVMVMVHHELEHAADIRALHETDTP
ncbi:MAG: maleylpyruvate isomerase N-terminal domain-containing protein [Anaerolineae bacterium]|nr:maleylpyruvate isomerase N-terminal domain-containing protein [Anaerolineae bacterium]